MSDITTPLKVGVRVYVGGATAKAGPGWKTVDVRDLPESPKSLSDIPMVLLKSKVRAVVKAVRNGSTVLVRCQHGVSRSPTVAKIALGVLGSAFRDRSYFPSGAWSKVSRFLRRV